MGELAVHLKADTILVSVWDFTWYLNLSLSFVFGRLC